MNNANPLIPQGSLLEQKAKSRPHLRIAIFIVAVHVVFLGGLLIQGCKREDETKLPPPKTNETGLPPLEPLYGTNLSAGMTSAVPPEIAPILSTNAVPEPVFTPAPTPTTQDYTVARGDSFYSIGKKFGVSPNAIAKANPGVVSTQLRIGQKLQIPAPTTAPGTVGLEAPSTPSGAVYTVKSGDTLTKIAREHGTTVTVLQELNGLKTTRINIGQKLKLPAKPTPAEPVAPAPAPTYPPATNLGTMPPLTGAPTAR